MSDSTCYVSVFKQAIPPSGGACVGYRHKTTWDAWFKSMEHCPRALRKEDVKGWSPALFKCDWRKKEKTQFTYGIGLDYDNKPGEGTLTSIADAIRLWADYDFFLHTTFNSTIDVPRFRVILPFEERIAGHEDHELVWHFLNDICQEAEHIIDPKCKDSSRFFYLPGCPDVSQYFCHRNEGRRLDAASIVSVMKSRGERAQKQEEALGPYQPDDKRFPTPQGREEYDTTTKLKRAEAWMRNAPAAVSGSRGHDVFFKAALDLRVGFLLTQSEAYPLLKAYNARCRPPFTERELRHKLEEASPEFSTSPPGYILYRESAGYQQRKVAARQAAPAEPSAPPEPVEPHIVEDLDVPPPADIPSGTIDEIPSAIAASPMHDDPPPQAEEDVWEEDFLAMVEEVKQSEAERKELEFRNKIRRQQEAQIQAAKTAREAQSMPAQETKAHNVGVNSAIPIDVDDDGIPNIPIEIDPTGKPKRGPKITIILHADLNDVLERTVSALQVFQDMYEGNDGISLIVEDRDADISAVGAQSKVWPIDKASLKVYLTRHIEYVKKNRDGDYLPVIPPDDLVNALHATQEGRGLRRLYGLMRTPYLRPDGSVCARPGYDPITGYVLDSTDRWLVIPDRCTQEMGAKALREIAGYFVDFPFVDDAAKYVAIAALLTLLGRPGIEGNVPAFVFSSNTPGTGKGYLADAISIIANGRANEKPNLPDNDEELGKVIGAFARLAPSVICFDDLKCPFGGGPLDNVLTADGGKTSVRMLGTLNMVRVNWRTVIFATGNNVAIKSDCARRTLISTMKSEREDPGARDDFMFPDLHAHVRIHRARIVQLALIVMRAYAQAGYPYVKVTEFGSFSDWRKKIACAIVFAGGEDPIKCLAGSEMAIDQHKDAIRSLLNCWEKTQPPGGAAKGLTIKAFLEKIYPGGREGYVAGFDDDELADVRMAIEFLCSLSSGSSSSVQPVSPIRLAARIRGAKDRVIDNKMFVMVQAKEKCVKWAVVPAKMPSFDTTK